MKHLKVFYIVGLIMLFLFACKKDAVVDLNKLVQVDSAQLAQGALVTVTRDTTTVTHFYQAAGSFVVTLMVMANPNNMLAKVSFGVKALGQQTKPEAIFSTKFNFPQNLNYVTFNSASSVNQGDIIQFKYNWGHGTEYISSVGLVRH